MPFMGTDLGKLMKHEKLSEDRIQFLVYQMLKGLKVGEGVWEGDTLRPGWGWGARCSQRADRRGPYLCPHSTSTPPASSTG